MSVGTGLLLGLGLLVGNGLFVAAEFAVISARRSQVEAAAARGHAAAGSTLFAMEHVSLMLACAQLGVTVCSLGLGAVAEPAVAGLLEPVLDLLGLPRALLHGLALALSLAAVVGLHVVVGEMVPKNLALAGPERAVLVLAPPLVGLARVLWPVIRLLNLAANALLRLVRVRPRQEVTSAFTAEQVASIVSASRAEGLLADEHGLLSGALELGRHRAGELALAPQDLVLTAARSTPQDLERLVARTGFSRYPVQGEDGGIVGYLHVKDLLAADDDRYTAPVPRRWVRPMATVQAGAELEEVLGALQRDASHLARVVHEDGTLVGVLFLEDVLEELVGDIRDVMQR